MWSTLIWWTESGKTYLITWDSEIDRIAQQTWENFKNFIFLLQKYKKLFSSSIKHDMTKRKTREEMAKFYKYMHTYMSSSYHTLMSLLTSD